MDSMVDETDTFQVFRVASHASKDFVSYPLVDGAQVPSQQTRVPIGHISRFLTHVVRRTSQALRKRRILHRQLHVRIYQKEIIKMQSRGTSTFKCLVTRLR